VLEVLTLSNGEGVDVSLKAEVVLRDVNSGKEITLTYLPEDQQVS